MMVFISNGILPAVTVSSQPYTYPTERIHTQLPIETIHAIDIPPNLA